MGSKLTEKAVRSQHLPSTVKIAIDRKVSTEGVDLGFVIVVAMFCLCYCFTLSFSLNGTLYKYAVKLIL